MSLRSVLLLAIVLPVMAGLAWAQGAGERRLAVLADVEGAIGPPAAHHIETVLETARERAAELVILRIDTPGGLATSMRDIISDILASPIPVVGYVAPPGARAASAGTYILYATSVAAMAPGTNLGAATPVQMGGGLPGLPSFDEKEKKEGKDGSDGEGNEEAAEKTAPAGDAMSAKMVNDAVAFIRSLAERYDRNADWAEKAVREAASLSANAALKERVIEIVAPDVASLLDDLDGRTVRVGESWRTLSTGNIAVETVEPSLMTRLLALITNPNVAFILMMIGVYGLIFEFSNPGSIGPGVAGVICLILGLYALNQLPLDYAGLALVGLGVILMVAEAFVPAFGALGVGGIAAFLIGAGMLIDTDVPAYQISWTVIGAMALLGIAVLLFVVGYVVRAYRRRVHTGKEEMVASMAHVLDWRAGEGHVWVHGERWQARGPSELEPGQTVRVDAVDGLTLVVTPETGAAARSAHPARET